MKTKVTNEPERRIEEVRPVEERPTDAVKLPFHQGKVEEHQYEELAKLPKLKEVVGHILKDKKQDFKQVYELRNIYFDLSKSEEQDKPVLPNLTDFKEAMEA